MDFVYEQLRNSSSHYKWDRVSDGVVLQYKLRYEGRRLFLSSELISMSSIATSDREAPRLMPFLFLSRIQSRHKHSIFHLCPNQNTVVCNLDTVFRYISATKCVEVGKHCVVIFNTVRYSYPIALIQRHLVTEQTFKSSICDVHTLF